MNGELLTTPARIELKHTAFLVIDVQNDFISGSLALDKVPGGEDGHQVVAPINHLLRSVPFGLVLYSLDWHPEGHCSFEGTNLPNGDKWPVHCLANSWGAQLSESLEKCPIASRVGFAYKGTAREVDSYSVFGATQVKAPWMKSTFENLAKLLREIKVDTVVVGGLATDYCVRATALDACRLGFETYLLVDCCRGTKNPSSQEHHQLMDQLRASGVQLTNSDRLFEAIGQ